MSLMKCWEYKCKVSRTDKKINSFSEYNIKPEYIEMIFRLFGNKSGSLLKNHFSKVEKVRFQEENVLKNNAPRQHLHY